MVQSQWQMRSLYNEDIVQKKKQEMADVIDYLAWWVMFFIGDRSQFKKCINHDRFIV
ncbi:hypothetical protein [Algibacillus agarilyticus]|uniref:hypothetical protein n=1 Tax=Algibacillus agarilyticus TaxID=2234133 RepID=UPI0013007CA9|nr:hypothetical protein [Algibacillus agarilyticus]